MISPRHFAAAVGAAALIAAVAGCGSTAGSSASATQSAAGGTGNAVTIKNFSFQPTPITVTAGTTITWTNTDASTHTVTADDKSFDSGNVMTSATFSHVFSTAGSYSYHCAIHNYMTATVVVSG